jgi:two-component system sensor histidine kinase KdpD
MMSGAFARLGGAVAAVALATLVMRVALPGWHVAIYAMLYLLVIQMTGLIAGRAPAMAAALAAFLALNYYFLEPVGRWSVSNPSEWFVLVVLLAAGLVSGQVAAASRARAEEARHREREMALLYELSKATAGQSDLEAVLTSLASRVREEFGGAPCEFLLADSESAPRPLSLPGIPGASPMPEFALRSGSREFGRMRVGRRLDGWPHSPSDRRLLDAVAGHAALAIERSRLAREAREAHLLRDSDSLKSKLLSAVSHDLRTPLTGIKALTTALLQSQGSLPESEIHDALEGIDQETDRMTRLVGNLLDLSRIEAGVLQPRREPVLAAELVDDTLQRLGPVLADRPVERAVGADLPVASLDYVQMQQVLSNLLENAGRYSPAGSPITIGAAASASGLELWVADRGPGIPPDQRERVFDRFYRLEHHEIERRGSGMGLAISRGLVEAHGGKLWVEERPGGGALFRLKVPLDEHGAAKTSPGDR